MGSFSPAEPRPRMATANPLIRKLESFAPLSVEDRQAVEAACGRTMRLGLREDIIHHGDPTGGVNLVLSGWACRYKQLEDGRRRDPVGYAQAAANVRLTCAPGRTDHLQTVHHGRPFPT